MTTPDFDTQINLHPTRKHRITFESSTTFTNVAVSFYRDTYLDEDLGWMLRPIANRSLFDTMCVELVLRAGHDNDTESWSKVWLKWDGDDDAWHVEPYPYAVTADVEFVIGWLREGVLADPVIDNNQSPATRR